MNKNIGYNSSTSRVEDLMSSGVTDPANIVLNSVKNALSVAAAVITTETIVTLPKHDELRPQVAL